MGHDEGPVGVRGGSAGARGMAAETPTGEDGSTSTRCQCNSREIAVGDGRRQGGMEAARASLCRAG